MTRSDVAGLSVPPPTAAQLAFREEMREAREKRKAEYATRQSVSVVGSPSGATVRVVLQGAYIDARLTPSARDVHPGDRAIVQKKGGVWTVVEVETWREPPVVGPKPAPASIPAAQTNNDSKPGLIPSPGDPPTGQVRETLTNHTARLQDLMAFAMTTYNYLLTLRSGIHTAYTQIDNLRSATNTNASRQNQTRDAATSAVNAVGGLHDAATSARIGKVT